jgi:hypothetical protein
VTVPLRRWRSPQKFYRRDGPWVTTVGAEKACVDPAEFVDIAQCAASVAIRRIVRARP